MLFKVESRSTGRSTHCGVLEFSADEGMVYMPYWVGGTPSDPSQRPGVSSSRWPMQVSYKTWMHSEVVVHAMQMMQNLLIEEGSLVSITSATLPKGTYVKLQPHTKVRRTPLTSFISHGGFFHAAEHLCTSRSPSTLLQSLFDG